jgi:hypothetical protein
MQQHGRPASPAAGWRLRRWRGDKNRDYSNYTPRLRRHSRAPDLGGAREIGHLRLGSSLRCPVSRPSRVRECHYSSYRHVFRRSTTRGYVSSTSNVGVDAIPSCRRVCARKTRKRSQPGVWSAKARALSGLGAARVRRPAGAHEGPHRSGQPARGREHAPDPSRCSVARRLTIARARRPASPR